MGLVKGNTLYWVTADHLGRPEVVTNASQQIVWRAANQAFDRSVLVDQIGGYRLGFPGQSLDAESGLWHNGFRDYDASLGRYVQSDPIGLAGGVSTYAYAVGDPVRLFDPLGLTVRRCKQAAQIPGFGWVDHHWIKTDTLERGMGGTRGNVPGNDSGDRPGDPVQVTEHAGRSEEAGVSCETVPNVDEKRVNEQLKLGTPLGLWGATNNCQTFVQDVLDNARYAPGASRTWTPHPGASGEW